MDKEYWANLYTKHKHMALCLDIEVTGVGKEISVVCLYRPSEGVPQVTQLVRGKDLNKENLKSAFEGCKLLITYNGRSMDLPNIEKEFPGVLPKVPNFDVYLFAKLCGFNTNLKTLENTFGVERFDEFSKRRHIAVKLWKRYEERRSEDALKKLLEYNKQDTINLYPLAEDLVKRSYQVSKQTTSLSDL